MTKKFNQTLIRGAEASILYVNRVADVAAVTGFEEVSGKTVEMSNVEPLKMANPNYLFACPLKSGKQRCKYRPLVAPGYLSTFFDEVFNG